MSKYTAAAKYIVFTPTIFSYIYYFTVPAFYSSLLETYNLWCKEIMGNEYLKSDKTDECLNELQILERIRAGEKSSFDEFFRLYYERLCRFAWRYVKDTSAAENIVQEVFLKIWQNRDKLDPSFTLKSYIFTAVRNTTFNYIRDKKSCEYSAEEYKTVLKTTSTPEDDFSEKELISAIHNAINELPEGRRNIFMMHRYDRLTYSEIAEIQNISINTVQTQMIRSLKHLRKKLASFITTLI